MPRRRIAKGAARSRAQIAAQQKAAEASARKRRKHGGDEPSARRAVARLDTNAPNNKKDLVALKEATKGGTAKGKVSLTASAKVSRENVINDADRIAYRAAAAESRKLKVTLGDNAPTADKIFSTAKKIAKIRAGDSEVKTADVKKASLSLDPDEKTPEVAKKVPLAERTLINTALAAMTDDRLREEIKSEPRASRQRDLRAELATRPSATPREKRFVAAAPTKKPVSERSLAQLKKDREGARGEELAEIRAEIERKEAGKIKAKNREGSTRGRLVSRDVNNESKAQLAAHNAGQSPFVKVNGETLTPAQKKTFDEIVKTHGKDQGALIDFARSKNGTLRKALMNEAQKVGDARTDSEAKRELQKIESNRVRSVISSLGGSTASIHPMDDESDYTYTSDGKVQHKEGGFVVVLNDKPDLVSLRAKLENNGFEVSIDEPNSPHPKIVIVPKDEDKKK